MPLYYSEELSKYMTKLGKWKIPNGLKKFVLDTVTINGEYLSEDQIDSEKLIELAIQYNEMDLNLSSEVDSTKINLFEFRWHNDLVKACGGDCILDNFEINLDI